MRRLLLLVPLLAACDFSDPPDPGNASFSYRESVEQVHVWRATPGAALELWREGERVDGDLADEQGSLIFRGLAPGDGYVVRSGSEYTRRMRVVSAEESLPEPSFYARQKLVPGFQYLTMRDGTKLSAYVTLPGDPEDGPYPTVVNYSGYSPSKPGRSIAGMDAFCNDLPVFCDAPAAEASLFAALLGYATVNVNMRGTGCSGGAYDYFETLQVLDGYDVVEIAAAQEWVKHRKVGMVGLSFPGITQLFVARARPPGLAAITPFSVIGNTATTLVPGGMLNDGFALSWVAHVLDKAKPYGQGWERARVEAGDTVCEENQLLHSQRVDNVEQARRTPFYVPERVDPLNPEKWVHEIEVPVFLAGAWQDEQTGPYFGTLLHRFENARAFRATMLNGVHIDSYAPAIFHEWAAFLGLFVAREIPSIPKVVRAVAPGVFTEIFDASLDLPPDRFTRYSTYEAALDAWLSEPPFRVLFESGAGGKADGAPVPRFEHSFSRWPPAELEARRWFFHPGGRLDPALPATGPAASEFAVDPEAGQRGILAPRGKIWAKAPDYDWRPIPEGRAVAFESAPLDEDLVMAGTGSVDLWIRSSAAEADLEVNLTEIRPDGVEMYVQSGWLRASRHVLDRESTELYPSPTHLAEDSRPLVPGEWTEVRVALAPFAHAFRKGSRLRLFVDTPGDSRAEWRFLLAPVPEGSTVAVGHDAARPSSVALPVLGGVTALDGLPACVVRGQQCRPYAEYTNAPAP